MLPNEFSKKVAQVIGQNKLLFKQGAKEAAAYIAELQLEVRSAIIGAKGFELAHLKAIRNQLDAAGKDLQKKFTIAMHANQEGAFSLGSSAVPAGFKTVGINLKLPMVSDALLSTAKDYSADLIKNLSADLIDEVSGYVRRGIITGRNPYDVMESIANNIFPGEAGAFGRAETIVRTENNRIFELANQERLNQIAEVVPTMKKTWMATDDERTRDSHRQAEIDYAPGGPIGPIPVDEPFVIDGVELMMPNDPDGDPHEVINCRCVSLPYMDNWEKETAVLNEEK